MNKNLLLSLMLCSSLFSFGNTIVVTNSDDSGAGSLRQAVLDANANSGIDTIFFDASTNGNPIVLTSGTIIIEDTTFVIGNQPSNTSISGGFTIITVSTQIECTIEGIHFSDFSDIGISRPPSPGSSGHLEVLNCEFIGNGIGFGVKYIVLGSIVIEGCIFSNLHNGLYIGQCTNVSIRNNYANNCTGDIAGFYMNTTVTNGDIVITNNTAENCNNGFIFRIGPNAEINNNTAYNNSSFGMEIRLPSFGSSSAIISNNTFANNLIGISIYEDVSEDASAMIIQNCIMWNNIDDDFNLTSATMSGGNPVFTNNIGSSSNSAYGPLSFMSTTDPLLDVSGAQDNGGITPTIQIGAGSLAIDSGIVANAPINDQRDFSRNGAVDIGAFEFNGVDPSNGIVNNNFENEITVYPIPTQGNLSIDLGKAHTKIQIGIVDLNGRLIHSQEFVNSQTMNFSIDVSPGSYLLIIESEGKRAIIKLIKT